MKGYRKYFGKKIIWFLITFVVAVFLNFFLPRLMPADPVAAITGKMANGMSDASAVQEIYERYAEQFGTNKPMAEQFLIFCKNAHPRRLWAFLQPVSQIRQQHYFQRHHVDDLPAVARNPGWLAAW